MADDKLKKILERIDRVAADSQATAQGDNLAEILGRVDAFGAEAGGDGATGSDLSSILGRVNAYGAEGVRPVVAESTSGGRQELSIASLMQQFGFSADDAQDPRSLEAAAANTNTTTSQGLRDQTRLRQAASDIRYRGLTVPEKVGSAVGSAVQGVASVPAGILKSIPVLAQRLNAIMPEGLQDATLREGDIEDRALYQLGRAIEEFVAEHAPREEAAQGRFLVDVLPQAIGSMAGFGAVGRGLGAVGASTPVATSTAGAGSSVTQLFEEARQHGATTDEAAQAALPGILIGATEALPIERAFSRFGDPGKVLQSGLIGAAEEATQEGLQGYLSDVVARHTFDPDREPGLDTEGAAAGGISGFLMNAVLTGLGARRQRRLEAGRQPSDNLSELLDRIDAFDAETDQQADDQVPLFQTAQPVEPQPPGEALAPRDPQAQAAPGTGEAETQEAPHPEPIPSQYYSPKYLLTLRDDELEKIRALARRQADTIHGQYLQEALDALDRAKGKRGDRPPPRSQDQLFDQPTLQPVGTDAGGDAAPGGGAGEIRVDEAATPGPLEQGGALQATGDAGQVLPGSSQGQVGPAIPSGGLGGGSVQRPDAAGRREDTGGTDAVSGLAQGSARIVELPVDEVRVDEGRFQPRDARYSEQTARNIDENFDPALLAANPAIVWRDPKDGHTYVLAGHSRREGLRRRQERTGQVHRMPLVYFQGTEQEAIDFAHTENDRGARLRNEERAKHVRSRRERGDTMTAIREEAQRLYGRDAPEVIDYSYLSERGQALGALRQFAGQATKDSRDAANMARWVGRQRRRHPELTDSHEDELFRFLLQQYNRRFTTAPSFDAFTDDIIQRRTTFGTFAREQPLNIQDARPESKAEAINNEAVREAERELSKSKRALDKARKRFIDQGARGEDLDRVLKPFVDEVNVDQRRLLEALRNRDQGNALVRDQQKSLFDLGASDEQIRATEGQPANESLEPAIQALESQEEDPDQEDPTVEEVDVLINDLVSAGAASAPPFAEPDLLGATDGGRSLAQEPGPTDAGPEPAEPTTDPGRIDKADDRNALAEDGAERQRGSDQPAPVSTPGPAAIQPELPAPAQGQDAEVSPAPVAPSTVDRFSFAQRWKEYGFPTGLVFSLLNDSRLILTTNLQYDYAQHSAYWERIVEDASRSGLMDQARRDVVYKAMGDAMSRISEAQAVAPAADPPAADPPAADPPAADPPGAVEQPPVDDMRRRIQGGQGRIQPRYGNVPGGGVAFATFERPARNADDTGDLSFEEQIRITVGQPGTGPVAVIVPAGRGHHFTAYFPGQLGRPKTLPDGHKRFVVQGPQDEALARLADHFGVNLLGLYSPGASGREEQAPPAPKTDEERKAHFEALQNRHRQEAIAKAGRQGAADRAAGKENMVNAWWPDRKQYRHLRKAYNEGYGPAPVEPTAASPPTGTFRPPRLQQAAEQNADPATFNRAQPHLTAFIQRLDQAGVKNAKDQVFAWWDEGAITHNEEGLQFDLDSEAGRAANQADTESRHFIDVRDRGATDRRTGQPSRSASIPENNRPAYDEGYNSKWSHRWLYTAPRISAGFMSVVNRAGWNDTVIERLENLKTELRSAVRRANIEPATSIAAIEDAAADPDHGLTEEVAQELIEAVRADAKRRGLATPTGAFRPPRLQTQQETTGVETDLFGNVIKTPAEAARPDQASLFDAPTAPAEAAPEADTPTEAQQPGVAPEAERLVAHVIARSLPGTLNMGVIEDIARQIDRTVRNQVAVDTRHRRNQRGEVRRLIQEALVSEAAVKAHPELARNRKQLIEQIERFYPGLQQSNQKTVETAAPQTEQGDDATAASDVEPNRPRGDRPVGEPGVDDSARSDPGGPGAPGQAYGGSRVSDESTFGPSSPDPAVVRSESNHPIHPTETGPDPTASATDAGERAGDGDPRIQTGPARGATTPRDTTAALRELEVEADVADLDEGSGHDAVASITERRRQQKKAASISVKPGIDNIRATLPMLLPEQQEDVHLAEQRFENTDLAQGKGYLFTNGTGTGKTYTGLGIARRFERQGKGRILILVPTADKAKDWIEDGKNLDLEITQLRDTRDKGEGIVVTTYANASQNDHLLKDRFDLVIPDESHMLLGNRQGKHTIALDRFRMLVNHKSRSEERRRMADDRMIAHNQEVRERADEIYQREVKKNKKYKRIKAYRQARMDLSEQYNQIIDAQDEEGLTDGHEADQAHTKVVMLSATPFPYHFSLDMAEGLLFEFSDEDGAAYNSGDGRERFYMEHLGYDMRTNLLTTPEAGIDVSLLERDFFDRLVDTGVASGRVLSVDKDYSRQFVTVGGGVGTAIEEGIKLLHARENDERFDALRGVIDRRMNFLNVSRLLEGIKAKNSIERIRRHIALGRRVAVYHNYNTGRPAHPFDFVSTLEADAEALIKPDPERRKKDPEAEANQVAQDRALFREKVRRQAKDFHATYPQYGRLNLDDLANPIETITNAFPGRSGIYNGTVPKGRRRRVKEAFNAGELDVIVVQTDAGKQGISLHDKDGAAQRVLINLGLPIKPVDAIQIEGRINRWGMQSNGIVEYPVTGLMFETTMFGSTIARRSRTAENLALGSQARNMERQFVEGFLDAAPVEPSVLQGTGGKAQDEADRQNRERDPFRETITHYLKQGKRTSKTKSYEGTDYYATPEPLGFKMVEMLQLEPGDDVLEPSGGHGAIARYFPGTTSNTAIEPSYELQSRLSVVAGGAKIVHGQFESHHKSNKYDSIAMNPPFGRGGGNLDRTSGQGIRPPSPRGPHCGHPPAWQPGRRSARCLVRGEPDGSRQESG